MGPGSAAHRSAKSYALRCVRGTRWLKDEPMIRSNPRLKLNNSELWGGLIGLALGIFVIRSGIKLKLGSIKRRIAVTLTNRGDMLFPMLIGRTALGPGIVVDPSRRYLLRR